MKILWLQKEKKLLSTLKIKAKVGKIAFSIRSPLRINKIIVPNLSMIN